MSETIEAPRRLRTQFSSASVTTLVCEVVKMVLHRDHHLFDPISNVEDPWEDRSRQVVERLGQSMAYAQSEVFEGESVVQGEIQDIRWLLQETLGYQLSFGSSQGPPD